MITFNLNPVEIVAVCSMLVTITGAIAILAKPFRMVKKKTKELEALKVQVDKNHSEHEKLENAFEQRVKEQDIYNAITTRAVTALLLHEMTNNETGQMKAAYEEIRDYHLKH